MRPASWTIAGQLTLLRKPHDDSLRQLLNIGFVADSIMQTLGLGLIVFGIRHLLDTGEDAQSANTSHVTFHALPLPGGVYAGLRLRL